MKKIINSFVATFALAGLAAGPARAAVSPLDLVGPLSDYKIFVTDTVQQLVTQTQAFAAAVESGDLAKAKALYAPTRAHYETIEPIAELFSDLDTAIDSRADDHEKREQDPGFVGFHRIEYGLYTKGSTDGLAPLAKTLTDNVEDLQKRVADLTFPPDKVVGGASDLMEEVAATKISGEEDRYSHTDLSDFQANINGSKKIFDLFSPLIAKDDATFVGKVQANFATVDTILAKYQQAGEFETYDKLSEADRRVLAGAVNTLAEDLSMLRGKLGLN